MPSERAYVARLISRGRAFAPGAPVVFLAPPRVLARSAPRDLHGPLAIGGGLDDELLLSERRQRRH